MGLKRILLVTDLRGWGGWTRGQYIKKYLSPDFKIDLMTADQFNVWEGSTNKKLFTIDDVHQFKNGHSKDKEYFQFPAFQKFVRQKKERNYDLYYFLFHTMLVKKSVKRMLNDGERVVTVVTGFPTLKRIFYGKKLSVEMANRRFLELSRKCQAIGANNQKSLRDLKSIYDGKTFYVPRGVDPEIFYPMRTEPNTDEKFTVAYVGKPVPEKGLEAYIRPACRKADCRLIVNDRNYTDALPPQEMNLFYNKADVYIVASTIDGTPNPALEAASCGKPIISNPIGNMPEFIKNGHNGFLLKERKVNKYTYALTKLKEDRQLAYDMGMNARQTIIRDWTWKSTCELERNMIKRILL